MNSFSFSLTGCRTKAKEPNLYVPYPFTTSKIQHEDNLFLEYTWFEFSFPSTRLIAETRWKNPRLTNYFIYTWVGLP